MEIINALEYLHGQEVVHRDMKPENILIDKTFHCKISDFGSAKRIDADEVNQKLKKKQFNYDELDSSDLSEDEVDFGDDFYASMDSSKTSLRQDSYIGTPLYISPEMLRYNLACFESDLWGLGCIIYQCLTGRAPFEGSNQDQVFDQILQGNIRFPSNFDPEAKDLISKLLKLHPRERLGSNSSFDTLKSHPFFDKKSFWK